MTKRMVAVVTLCLFVLLTGLAFAQTQMVKPTNKDAAKKMDKVEKALKDKEFDKALALTQEVIQLEPTYAPAYYYNGAIHLQKKENDLALPMLEKAVQLKPDFAPALTQYAALLSFMAQEMNAQKQPEKAMEYYSRIIALPNLETLQKPRLIEATFNQGIIAFQAQKHEKSNEVFARMMSIQGIETEAKQNWVLAHYVTGFNYSILNKPEESNARLLKYLDLTSAEPANQFTAIAEYLVGKNEYGLLDAEVTKARNDTTVTTDLRTRVQDLAKSHSRVQEMLQKSLAIKPDLEDAYIVLGNYYYLGHDLDQAIATYKTLIEKFPASPALADYQNFLKKLEDEKNPPPPPPAKAKGKKK
jgi:tetratricopeptide (TPR) repeat protein